MERPHTSKLRMNFLKNILCQLLLFTCICEAVNRNLLESPQHFCVSAGCYDAGIEIMSSLNTSVNACDDFYQYACGGWIKKHAIPKNTNRFSVFSKFQDEQLRDMFTEQLNQGAPLFIRVLKQIYDTCMDEVGLPILCIKS
ncbi:membrane metallo-endopeptidase-like 1 [Stegodyphus dumicola]|uniref:membrane metallo-endopeptidase-like 1 n=1 Tax=Stegodyphus dumicola TaxID=202533 RepID=UPI0015A9EE14|nr:membrane metallo-endopeptidase-like 1 [Stegodyphus dumicola]